MYVVVNGEIEQGDPGKQRRKANRKFNKYLEELNNSFIYGPLPCKPTFLKIKDHITTLYSNPATTFEFKAQIDGTYYDRLFLVIQDDGLSYVSTGKDDCSLDTRYTLSNESFIKLVEKFELPKKYVAILGTAEVLIMGATAMIEGIRGNCEDAQECASVGFSSITAEVLSLMTLAGTAMLIRHSGQKALSEIKCEIQETLHHGITTENTRELQQITAQQSVPVAVVISGEDANEEIRRDHFANDAPPPYPFGAPPSYSPNPVSSHQAQQG